MPKKCKCGTSNSDNAQYCRNCGCKLIENEPIKIDTNPEKVSSSNNDAKMVLRIISSICIVVTLILFFTDAIGHPLAIALVGGSIYGLKAWN